MKQILQIVPALLFFLKGWAQYPQNKDSVWIRENRIESLTFYQNDRTHLYTFDRKGKFITELIRDSMNNELESVYYGEFERRIEGHYGVHTIRKQKYDSLCRIESEYNWTKHKSDVPGRMGKVDSMIHSYSYPDGMRIKNYKWYERSYYYPETRLAHEYYERTYFTVAGADSLIITTYPTTVPPDDTSNIIVFEYTEGQLVSCNYYSNIHYKLRFSPFLYRSQHYSYYPDGALKTRIYSEFSRSGQEGNTVDVYTYTEDGYISQVDYTSFDEETRQMQTSSHAYTEEEIYREKFCYRIEAARARNECVDITYYR